MRFKSSLLQSIIFQNQLFIVSPKLSHFESFGTKSGEMMNLRIFVSTKKTRPFSGFVQRNVIGPLIMKYQSRKLLRKLKL